MGGCVVEVARLGGRVVEVGRAVASWRLRGGRVVEVARVGGRVVEVARVGGRVVGNATVAELSETGRCLGDGGQRQDVEFGRDASSRSTKPARHVRT